MEQLKQSPWVVCINKQPEAVIRLFCFPYAGGGTSIFRLWSKILSPQVEVYAIQLPGRENRFREKPYNKIEPVVEEITKEIMTYIEKPYALFGHSMGALLSFEVARQLRRKNIKEPMHLFASGRRAPQVPDRLPPIHHLPEREFIEGLKRYDGIPQAVLQEKELMELFLPVLKADITLNETYRYSPEPPLECSITGFGGVNDKTVNREEVLAWQQQTSSRFNSQFFAGGHFFLNENRDELLQVIKKEVVNNL